MSRNFGQFLTPLTLSERFLLLSPIYWFHKILDPSMAVTSRNFYNMEWKFCSLQYVNWQHNSLYFHSQWPKKMDFLCPCSCWPSCVHIILPSNISLSFFFNLWYENGGPEEFFLRHHVTKKRHWNKFHLNSYGMYDVTEAQSDITVITQNNRFDQDIHGNDVKSEVRTFINDVIIT